MKKFYLLFLLAMLSLQANADPVEIGGIYYNLFSGGKASVAPNPNGKYSGSIIIPESVTYGNVTYSVTSIDYGAFKECSGLTSITIPNSVTSIGQNAFNKCSGLTSVIIPNSVTSIDYGAFKECSGLTSITIPNSVTRLGSSAFDGTAWYDNQPEGVVYAGQIAYKYKGEMPANTTISLNEGTIGITDDAFSGCSGLTSVAIPNSVTFIGHAAFTGCSGLTSVAIPNGMTSIGTQAFMACRGLTSVTIPNSVTDIGIRSFEYCSSLESIVVESGNTVYDSRDNCNAIIETAKNKLITGCKTTVIPNNVISIGSGAFLGCRDLTSVTIPNSVTSILSDAFADCRGLTSVTIPSSVTSIGYSSFGTFASSSSLTSVTSLAQMPPQAKDDSFSKYDIPLYVPNGTRDAYLAASPWNKFKEIIELENTDEDEITIKDIGKTTWCSEYDLDFTNVAGIKAYIAMGYDDNEKTIWLARVMKVPAGTGLLVKGDPGTYKIPHVSVRAYYTNMLVGNLGDQIKIEETDGDKTNYYLSGKDGSFVSVNGNANIGKNKAYLQLPTSVFGGTRSIDINYDDEDGTTSIREVKSGEVKGEEWFTLQGQRVNNPGKGLYIRNGKVVIVR